MTDVQRIQEADRAAGRVDVAVPAEQHHDGHEGRKSTANPTRRPIASMGGVTQGGASRRYCWRCSRPVTLGVESRNRAIRPSDIGWARRGCDCLSSGLGSAGKMAPMSGPASSGDVIDEGETGALQAVAVQFFVNGAVFASFLPRLPEIRDRVGLDVGGIGLLMSLAGVGLATGVGLRSRGTRRVMIGAEVLLASALPFVGLARTPVVLLCGLAAMSGPTCWSMCR